MWSGASLVGSHIQLINLYQRRLVGLTHSLMEETQPRDTRCLPSEKLQCSWERNTSIAINPEEDVRNSKRFRASEERELELTGQRQESLSWMIN